MIGPVRLVKSKQAAAALARDKSSPVSILPVSLAVTVGAAPVNATSYATENSVLVSFRFPNANLQPSLVLVATYRCALFRSGLVLAKSASVATQQNLS